MIVYCCGTSTEVGKTWVGARAIEALRSRGLTVAAAKPAQSFDPADPSPTDAAVLAAASGQTPEDVTPAEASFELAMAPPMAAAELGRPAPTIADMAKWAQRAAGMVDVTWVEGVGGPRSPHAADGHGVDLADALKPAVVVLVADADLGVINAVELCRAALGDHLVVTFLNRFDGSTPIHRLNRSWLERSGQPLATEIPDLAELIADRLG